MALEHNTAELADSFDLAAGELADLEATNAAAGRLTLEHVDRETPRRTGTLAAGARCVADALGFAYVNATPYAVIVDTKTGFASDTLAKVESTIAGVYEDHVEAALAPLT